MDLLYLNDFCCISANFVIRIYYRVWREVFNLGKIVAILFGRPLKDQERVSLAHNKQEISFELNHMLYKQSLSVYRSYVRKFSRQLLL